MSVVFILTLLVSLAGGQQKEPGQQRPADYAPGIRIDWVSRRMELEGKVVLRDGPLELFACSPQTREHESIVAVRARPLRIYEAMGLIGLTPGHPVQYDPDKDTWTAPTGDAVAVQVRWEQNGRDQTADIGEWMKDVAGGRIVPPGSWVFCGSYRDEDGVFGADLDGTVICVVDFSSALIALPELHTAENQALWLAADPSKIPPLGTPVTLVIRAAEPNRLAIRINAKGIISCDSQTLALKDVADRVQRFQRDHRNTVILILDEADAPRDVVQRVTEVVTRNLSPGTSVQTGGDADREFLDAKKPPGDSNRP